MKISRSKIFKKIKFINTVLPWILIRMTNICFKNLRECQVVSLIEGLEKMITFVLKLISLESPRHHCLFFKLNESRLTFFGTHSIEEKTELFSALILFS